MSTHTQSTIRKKIGLGVTGALLVIGMTMGQASAGSQTSAGAESSFLDEAALWFQSQREAPNNYVNPDAFAALRAASSRLSTASGSWTERTPRDYFTDSPTYAPIGASCGANCFQNSGSGERYVSGRMTAVAVAGSGDVFAGAADGGIWKSTNRGASWTPVGDFLGTMSIGALLIEEGSRGKYTVYAGTGEANTSSDSYAGIGVLKSTDGGGTWTQMPTTAVKPDGSATAGLNGALIFRLLRSGSYLYAATSHGLYRIDAAGAANWTRILQFDDVFGSSAPVNLRVWNMITDVITLPGSGHLLAVAGWRGGEPTNGLYESQDAGNSFTYIANPNGWVPAKSQGRISLARSSDGGTLVAVIQSASTFIKPNASGTILAGVYASKSGPAGPWNQIASSGKLSSSGSAETRSAMRGYKPGVQAWYNQFVAVDPANANHIYLGLEEVYETTNGGSSWDTLGPYWNLTLQCFSYTPFEGTCNHQQTHPDQHGVFIDAARNTVFVANDGGMWSKSMSDHSQGNWNNLNRNINTLQYYSAAGSTDGSLYGGLQDNGTSLTFPSARTVVGDTGAPVPTTSVQVFGGDGGYTIVDPSNSQNAITEYVGLTSARTSDGGKTWIGNQPPDPNARFIAPIVRDYTQAVVGGNTHIVSGGALVWDSVKGFNTNSSDWTGIFDLRTLSGTAPAAHQTTAIGTATLNGVTTIWAAWCGPCNPNGAGNGFQSGLVVLSNSGGSYHLVNSYTTGGANGLPPRYITGVFVNPSNPADAYLSFSGYSRNWYVGALDSGVGHIFEINGAAVSNRTGNLIDSPATDVLRVNGHLVAGTDFGVYVSSDNGGTWSRLGANLPNVVVDQLVVADGGASILAATHGRGLWAFPVSGLS
ncbi:MAG: hypothetical protein E6J16_02590 [Chloroflexota bacterium]|nr:MAG: hypothetical protein E6J16_02590 [Chloroflexota bacterium]